MRLDAPNIRMPAELLGWSLSYLERESTKDSNSTGQAASSAEPTAPEELKVLRFAMGENTFAHPMTFTVREPEAVSALNTSSSCWVCACSSRNEVRAAKVRWRAKASTGTSVLVMLGFTGSPLEGMLDAYIYDPGTGDVIRPASFQIMPTARRVDFTRGATSEMHRSEGLDERGMEPPPDSRTAGALGADTIRRLARLNVAVAGTSRTGSLIVESLVRGYGVRKFTLIDGDVLEGHNLREASSLFPSDGVGKNKAHVLQQVLEQQYPDCTVRSVSAMLSPGSPATVTALASADLIVTCTDTEASVLFANAIACAAGALHLDIGTGVLPETDGAVSIGADVRLFAPGLSNGCALCFGGGIAGQETLSGAIKGARDLDSLSPRGDPDAWRRQRAGSLLSINQLATSIGCRLLEDVAREATTRSCHVHLEGVASRQAPVTYIRPSVPSDCLCRHHGAGDQGIRAVISELGGTCFN